ERPLVLSSTIRDDNNALGVDLTNPDITHDGRMLIPRGTLHIARDKFLRNGACYERLTVRNFQSVPVSALLTIRFEADFADIFEVRGMRRAMRGKMLTPTVQPDCVILSYLGLDSVTRRTRLRLQPPPERLSPGNARFRLELAPQAEATIELTVDCNSADSWPELMPLDDGWSGALHYRRLLP